MFRADEKYDDVEINDDFVNISNASDVLTSTGWCNVKLVGVGDYIEMDEGWALVSNKEVNDCFTTLYLE